MEGAYFKCIREGENIYKYLKIIEGGSPLPDEELFIQTHELLKDYLVEQVAVISTSTKPFIIEAKYIENGIDLFSCIDKQQNNQNLKLFASRVKELYEDTGIIPDLIGDNNVLLTNYGNIYLIDTWPVFTRKRVVEGDINEESWDENYGRYLLLLSYCD